MDLLVGLMLKGTILRTIARVFAGVLVVKLLKHIPWWASAVMLVGLIWWCLSWRLDKQADLERAHTVR